MYWVEANDIDVSYVVRMTSSDGVEWSDADYVIVDNRSAYETVSPTVEYVEELGLYYMWSVNLGLDDATTKNNNVELRTSEDGVSWSAPVALNNFTQEDCEIWHIYIRYVAEYDEYWCVFAAYPDGSNVGDTELYYAKSKDGKNWTTYYKSPVLQKGARETGMKETCTEAASYTSLTQTFSRYGTRQ